jgi:hypothetical protein
VLHDTRLSDAGRTGVRFVGLRAPANRNSRTGFKMGYGAASMQAAIPRPEAGHGVMNHNHLPVHPWSGIMAGRAADQTACRLSAEDLPVLRSATTSKAIFCPSLRARMPARSTALMWTKTSLPPSSGWIKPKPFWSLKNFTVPCGCNEAAHLRSRFVRDLEKGRQSDTGCAARPSRSAEARQPHMGPLSRITRFIRQESQEKAGYFANQHPS